MKDNPSLLFRVSVIRSFHEVTEFVHELHSGSGKVVTFVESTIVDLVRLNAYLVTSMPFLVTVTPRKQMAAGKISATTRLSRYLERHTMRPLVASECLLSCAVMKS